MSSTVDTLITKYVLDDSKYKSGASAVVNATGAVDNAFKKATASTSFLGQIQSGFDRAKPIIMGVVGAVGAVGASFVALGLTSSRAAADFDAQVQALTAIEGSAKRAKDALAELKDAAKLPGLGFQEAVTGFTQLRRAGVDAATAMMLIRGAGKANALAGGGREEFGRIGLALGQIAVKPQLQGEELLQLVEAGVNAYGIIKEAFGTADTEKLKQAGITSRQVITALAIGMNKLPSVGDTAKNAIENFGQAVDFAMIRIGQAVNSAALPYITKFTDAVEGLSDSGVIDSFGQTIVGIFESALPASDDFQMSLIEVGAGFVTAAAATRNFILNLQDLWKFFSKFVPLSPVLDFASGTTQGLSPVDEGDRFKAGALLNLERQRQARERQKKEDAERKLKEDADRKKIEEDAKNNKNSTKPELVKQTNYLQQIAQNTRPDLKKIALGGGNLGAQGISATTLSAMRGRKGGVDQIAELLRREIGRQAAEIVQDVWRNQRGRLGLGV